jgi:hypothetical protein
VTFAVPVEQPWGFDVQARDKNHTKALVRRAIFASNIAIKQYCDKAKIFFGKILLLLFKIS